MKNTKVYVDFITEKLKKLLSIDSPTGYTKDAIAWLKAEYEAMGYAPRFLYTLNATEMLKERQARWESMKPGTPTMMKFKTHADAGSLYNTPNCYCIYMCGKVFKWLKKMGGLEVMKQRNEEKAKLLYDFLDQSKLFKGTVVPEDRSLMNVPFITGNADLDAKFVKESKEAGLENLKGHRTVGGMRASIYNAMPKEGVEALVAFMKKFEEENL